MSRPLILTVAIITLIVSVSVAPLHAEGTGYLSDDGDVVTVAKVPDALKLANFSNHLGIAEHGTRVEMIEGRRDPAVPAEWVKVKILDGQYAGQTGWVLSQTYHEGKSLQDEPEDKAPDGATHRVVRDSPTFTEPLVLSPTGKRLAIGQWVQELSATDSTSASSRRIDTENASDRGRRDPVTSFQFVRVRIVGGESNGQVLWVPTHNLKQLRSRCVIIGQREPVKEGFQSEGPLGEAIPSTETIERFEGQVRTAWSQAKQIAEHPDVDVVAIEDMEPALGDKIDLSVYDEVAVLIHNGEGALGIRGVLLSGDLPTDLADKLVAARIRSTASVELVVCRAGATSRPDDEPAKSFASRLAGRMKDRGMSNPVIAYPHYVTVGTHNCYPQCESVTLEGYKYREAANGQPGSEETRVPVQLDRRRYAEDGSSEHVAGLPLFVEKHNRAGASAGP